MNQLIQNDERSATDILNATFGHLDIDYPVDYEDALEWEIFSKAQIEELILAGFVCNNP
tara:strand:- start:1539 stop:1715 length:177 start_codon:yes stop_codon:yes gene_type:complete